MDKWFLKKLKTSNLRLDGGMYQPTYIKAVSTSFDSAEHNLLYELEDNSFWFKHRNKVILESAHLYPPIEKRIVEVGAGNGNCTHYLQKNCFNTAMFEPGVGGCKNALKRGVTNIVCSMLSEEYVYKQSIESIGLFDVLEHIEDDVGFLSGLSELLVNDGLIYITVPAHKKLWSYSDKGHFRRYSKKQLQNVVTESGYKIIYDSYYFYSLLIPIFILRSLPYLFRRKNKKEVVLNGDNKINRNEFVVPVFIEKLINILLSSELRRIRKGKRIKIGASLILVAQKG